MVFIISLLGLIVGSFLGALTYRIPKGIGISKGRSFCPKCKKQINWYDNIPIISYIFLKGKCRNCKRKISFRYPLIEGATAILFFGICYLSPYLQGASLQVLYDWQQMLGVFTLPFLLILASILIALFVLDLEHQILPDTLVFTGYIILVLILVVFTPQNLHELFFAGFISSMFFLFLYFITKGKGMGLGDAKFAIFAGTLIGLRYIPVWLFLSFVLGGIVGIFLLIFGKAKMKTRIAFGPFLIISLVVTLLFGECIYRFLSY